MKDTTSMAYFLKKKFIGSLLRTFCVIHLHGHLCRAQRDTVGIKVAIDYFEQQGVYLMNRMIFPGVKAKSMTDVGFNEISCPSYLPRSYEKIY